MSSCRHVSGEISNRIPIKPTTGMSTRPGDETDACSRRAAEAVANDAHQDHHARGVKHQPRDREQQDDREADTDQDGGNSHDRTLARASDIAPHRSSDCIAG